MKNTDTKEKVIELFFDFPTKKFHLREISRILEISPPAISKALKQLEREGVLTIERKFLHEIKARLDNPCFRSFKRVHNLKKIYSSGLFSCLYDKFPLSAIILFGSYSRGEDIEKSDIDIAIETKTGKLNLEDYEKKLIRRINIEFIDFGKVSKELRDSIINGIVLSGYIRIK